MKVSPQLSDFLGANETTGSGLEWWDYFLSRCLINTWRHLCLSIPRTINDSSSLNLHLCQRLSTRRGKRGNHMEQSPHLFCADPGGAFLHGGRKLCSQPLLSFTAPPYLSWGLIQYKIVPSADLFLQLLGTQKSWFYCLKHPDFTLKAVFSIPS